MSKNEFYFLLLVLIGSFVSSCSDKSNIEKASGTVSVQIPVQQDASAYKLANVDLLGINNLREVAGAFVKFFYSPGADRGQLTGKAPVAHFAQTGATYYPTDYLSVQMATIYYHMQNLAAFDNEVGAGGINTWPRSVGLETMVNEDDSYRKNNAFYDGATDAMMFVPFTNQDLPISVNAGIIAHEHFHSLFYKMVLKSAVKNNKVLSNSASIHDGKSLVLLPASKIVKQDDDAVQAIQLYNEAYLRGINEGIADFWGWVYTEDADFMKWSLPGFVGNRTLTLNAVDQGRYETKYSIQSVIESLKQQGSEIHNSIMSYSYTVGTPHARFLKTYANIYAEESKTTLASAKLKVAKDVISFLQTLQQNMTAMKDTEALDAGGLFQYMADLQVKNKALGDKTCEFFVKYLNSSSDRTNSLKCDHKDGQSVMVEVTPATPDAAVAAAPETK